MSTPICHRTLGPMVRSYGDGEPGLHEAYGYACIGSACAMWVPEIRALTQSGMGYPAVTIDEDGDPVLCPTNEQRVLTGHGWCADNLRREPWLDPAEPVKAGGAS